MVLAAEMDKFGKAGWIAAMILAFIVFWPLGLAVLGFLIFSGRLLGHCGPNGAGRWQNVGDRRGPWGCGGGRGRWNRAQSSGNAAFDDYRTETLRRLEEEQQEFLAFLERLRRAKDKAEFDQFMNERRNRPESPDATPTGA